MRLRTPIFAAALVAISAPLALAADATVPDGKTLYQKKCAACHGADGVAKGGAKGSANFNDAAWQSKAKDDDIESAITKGKGKMKPIKMSAAEAHAIVAHIRTLK